MKSRYYLYRQGTFVEANDPVDLTQYQGYYCLDMGAFLDSPTWGILLNGRLKEAKPEFFPTAFRAHLLVLDVP
jgi:hypothetical protein